MYSSNEFERDGSVKMGSLIAIMIPLALLALSIIVPILLKIIVHLDYCLLLLVVWAYVFDANGPNGWKGLLSDYEIHTVFVILIFLAALGIWFGIQQIRIFNIYIFRVVACALSAFLFTYLLTEGLFGKTIADGMDTIWQWTVGIVYFGIVMALRAMDKSLTYDPLD